MRTPIADITIVRFDGERLRYAGAVGTGFSEVVAASLRERLDRIEAPACAVLGLRVGGAVWVSPDLRASICPRDLILKESSRSALSR